MSEATASVARISSSIATKSRVVSFMISFRCYREINCRLLRIFDQAMPNAKAKSAPTEPSLESALPCPTGVYSSTTSEPCEKIGVARLSAGGGPLDKASVKLTWTIRVVGFMANHFFHSTARIVSPTRINPSERTCARKPPLWTSPFSVSGKLIFAR